MIRAGLQADYAYKRVLQSRSPGEGGTPVQAGPLFGLARTGLRLLGGR
jgi:hypothetical protein